MARGLRAAYFEVLFELFHPQVEPGVAVLGGGHPGSANDLGGSFPRRADGDVGVPRDVVAGSE